MKLPALDTPRRLLAWGFSLVAVIALGVLVFGFTVGFPSGGAEGPDTTVALTTTTRAQPRPSPTSTVPTHDVEVHPGDDLGELARAHPQGTVFFIRAGTYRLAEVEPKDRQVFIGEIGAILDGSMVLSDFTQESGLWVAAGQTQGPGRERGQCEPGYSACGLPEMLYRDGAPLRQVASKRDVESGKWFFDYERDEIFFADDPTGHLIETSWAPHAFFGRATGVEIQGLIIRKYASPSTMGAVWASMGSDWEVIDSEVSYNHAVGIQLGRGSRATGNFVHHNGEKGISARDDGAVVSGNEISNNNIGGFDSTWAAGGAKFVQCTNLTVVDNHVHHNNGPGLWADIDCKDIVMSGNTTEFNAGPGIRIETSYNATIRDNTIRANHTDWGAGISIVSSPNVEVDGNTIEQDNILVVQTDRGSGSYGPYVVENLWVHDNVVTSGRGPVGMLSTDDTAFAGRNNRFDRNVYINPGSSDPFEWDGHRQTFAQWVEFGNDTAGSFS